ncbi:unnamed protein product [Brachionus calyciflorus]|uniref:Potassium channel domain-containing protein n=1 Tax=Brachionus calyciflorus TaxID=104777 RepID=A0A813M5K0_9BILA|nr:unnamed protein product [Brachionus calyciflorus]
MIQHTEAEANVVVKKSLKAYLTGKVKQQNEKNINQNEIDELLKPSPPLPMVKFDDDGDFFKEPLPNLKVDNDVDDNKQSNSHIIYIGDSITIDTKKAKKYLKRAFKFAFSQIGLAGLVVGYVIFGALLFMKIESDYEKENQNKIEKNREEFFENVKISAEHMFNSFLDENFHTRYSIYRQEEILRKNNELPYEAIYEPIKKINYNDNKNDSNQPSFEYASYGSDTIKFDKKSHESIHKPSWYIELDKERFYHEIKSHLRHLLIENDKIEDKDKPNMLSREDVWSYPNALLYSATVITTIGYGNITPKSNTGKILTIFYAMIGIPLMFMCLTNTGDLLAELFIISYSKCIRFFYRRIFKHKLKIPYSSSKFEENKQEMLNEFEMEYDNPNDRHVPIVATLGVLTAYIFAGAGIFAFTEEWSILDGAYFCFITFTTIGFGDFVPGKNTLATEKRGMAALCTLYLLVGMVIMAMCFKLMQDEVASKARWFGLRLGIIEQ